MVGSKYRLLIRLAEEKQRAAAQRMNQAQAALTRAKNQFEQLSSFVKEYQQRLTTAGINGIKIGQWQDFQCFLAHLNEAVCTQQQQVDTATQRFLLARHAWQEASKTLKIFEKLLARENEKIARQDARREQKLTDELAARCVGDGSRDQR